MAVAGLPNPDEGIPGDVVVPEPLPPPVVAPPIDGTMSQAPAGTNPGSGSRVAAVPVTPDGTVPVTVAASPKPTWETTQGHREVVEGAGAKKAVVALQGARGAEATAEDRAAVVDADEARERHAAAVAKAAELQAEQQRKAEAEAKRAQDRQKWIDGEKSMVRAEVEARKRTIDPEGDFWKGRPAARVFSNVLRVIGEIAAGVATPDDPGRRSRVDTAIDGMISGHRDKLVKAWEATAAAKKLHQENRAAWDAEKDKIEVAAANQSQAQLELIEAQLDKELARLGPAKAKAARAVLRASRETADRKFDLDRADKFNRISDFEHTQRAPVSATGATAKADDTAVFNPLTGAHQGDANTPAMAQKTNDEGKAYGGLVRGLSRLKEIAAALPKMRDPTSGEAQALQRERDQIIGAVAPQASQAFGSGAPSTSEFKTFAENLDRGWIQGQESYEKQVESFKGYLSGLWQTKLNGAGVNRNRPTADPTVDPGKKAPANPFDGKSDDQMRAAHTKALQDEDPERRARRVKAIREELRRRKLM
jgi:hypothetical protein